MLARTPTPTSADRLAAVTANVEALLPKLKPGRVQQAEADLVAASEARAKLSDRRKAAWANIRNRDDRAEMAPVVAIDAEIAEAELDIREARAVLQKLRGPYAAAVDRELAASLAIADTALAEAADTIEGAAALLRRIDHYRMVNGIAGDAPTKPRRDWRYLLDFIARVRR